MADLVKIHDTLAPHLERVNYTIKESLYSTNNLLKGIIDFFLEKKGKQIRPIFTFLIADLLGEPNDKTTNGAASIELLHNASLIHDDVIDNSEIRRNAQTLNKIWDNQIAVLVGDFFVTSALERALSTNNLQIVTAISELGRKLAVGELDQIYNAQNTVLNEDAYIKMVELKTASLFVTCAKIGAESVGASIDEINRVTEFARLLGICFQIKDDIFDYLGVDNNIVGKPVEADLFEGKISLPLLHVLIEDKKNGIDDFINLCLKKDLTRDEVSQLVKYANDKGGIAYAQTYMDNLYLKGKSILATFNKKDTVENLDALFRYVIERDH